jgi:K+/H+ antiporter YhaU regulatory subunit KhtT
VRAPRTLLQSLPDAIRRMPVSSHRVDDGHWAIGRTVGEISLRARTGATILAIQRGAKYLTALRPDDRIENADVLYLVGDDSDILLARQRLNEGA